MANMPEPKQNQRSNYYYTNVTALKKQQEQQFYNSRFGSSFSSVSSSRSSNIIVKPHVFFPVAGKFLLKENISMYNYRQLYLNSMYRFYAIIDAWNCIKVNKFGGSKSPVVANLNYGCSDNATMDQWERFMYEKCEGMPPLLPFDMRASWFLHNGELVTSNMIGNAGISNEPGIFHTQCRLLSLEEIANEAYSEQKRQETGNNNSSLFPSINDCIVYGKNSEFLHPSTTKTMKLVAVTSMNAIQYCVDLANGGTVYFRSGKYTLYYTSDSWLEFLYSIADVSTVQRILPKSPY